MYTYKNGKKIRQDDVKEDFELLGVDFSMLSPYAIGGIVLLVILIIVLIVLLVLDSKKGGKGGKKKSKK